MVVFNDFREILGIMALVTGFSIALLLLPNIIQNPAPVYAPTILSPAQKGAQVEKITVPIHTLFATQ